MKPTFLPRSGWSRAAGYIPMLRWLPHYPWHRNLGADVIASLCDAAVAAPESVTYANIAGLPGVSGEAHIIAERRRQGQQRLHASCRLYLIISDVDYKA